MRTHLSTAIEYCALKRASGDGWEIVMIPEGLGSLATAAAALHLQDVPLRKIACGGVPGQVTSLTIVPLDDAIHLTAGTGWAYDVELRCWRAPEDKTAPPPVGPRVDALEVTFDPPDAGWLNAHFRAGTQSFDCSLSNVFQDLRDIIEWLETVEAGDSVRFGYNVEGDEVRFALWPHADDLHLTIDFASSKSLPPAINVVIPRKSFVSSFYRALVTFWESSALVDNWREWACYTEQVGVEVDEHGYELHPYVLRSQQLDCGIKATVRPGESEVSAP